MPSLRLFRRDSAGPTLRQRAADLKASLARLTGRADLGADADRDRRAVVVSLAAISPMPALALAAPTRHPDAELFEAETESGRAAVALAAAREASKAASKAFAAAIGPYPEALRLQPWEDRAFVIPKPETGYVFTRQMWARNPDPSVWVQPARYWTEAGLRKAIKTAVPHLGRGGQTPHTVSRWRGLLPDAEAFDAYHAAVRARFNCDERLAAALAAEKAYIAAVGRFAEMAAVTPEGLAVKVRHLSTTDWRKMSPGWAALLQSAAAVSGVMLPKPPDDA